MRYLNKILLPLIAVSSCSVMAITESEVSKWVEAFDSVVQARNVQKVSEQLQPNFTYNFVSKQHGVTQNLNLTEFLDRLSEAGPVKIKTDSINITLAEMGAVVDLKRTIYVKIENDEISRTTFERIYLYESDNKLKVGQIDLIDESVEAELNAIN